MTAVRIVSLHFAHLSELGERAPESAIHYDSNVDLRLDWKGGSLGGRPGSVDQNLLNEHEPLASREVTIVCFPLSCQTVRLTIAQTGTISHRSAVDADMTPESRRGAVVACADRFHDRKSSGTSPVSRGVIRWQY